MRKLSLDNGSSFISVVEAARYFGEIGFKQVIDVMDSAIWAKVLEDEKTTSTIKRCENYLSMANSDLIIDYKPNKLQYPYSDYCELIKKPPKKKGSPYKKTALNAVSV